MWAMLIPLLSGLLGENGPLGQYFKIKADQVKAEEEYRLAALKASSEANIQASVADTTQRSNYLGATSSGFRQGTFYWISAIIFYSILFPGKAEALWHNFSMIPEWVQYIYIGMLSVTWGLPIAKENIGLMFSSIGRGMESHREYRLNRLAVFNGLKKDIFTKGMTPEQVKAVDDALTAGEAN